MYCSELAVTAISLASVYSLGWCLSLARRLRRFERTSRLDPLTGLGSGSWLDAERWPAALRSRQPLGVVYLDLDRLKQRNDCLGHGAGDAYIQSAAEALRGACRRGVDEVFRSYARGDEFVLLLHGPLPEPARFAAALLHRLRRYDVQASLGLAYTAEARYLPVRADLRIRAEAACRKAKRCGGDCALLVLDDPYGTMESLIRADESAILPSLPAADNVPTLVSDQVAARLDRPQTVHAQPRSVQP